MNFGEIEALIPEWFRVASFGFDDLKQGYIFGELGDVVAVEVGDGLILKTGHPITTIFLFSDHGIEAGLAVAVSAGSQQAGHVLT